MKKYIFAIALSFSVLFFSPTQVMAAQNPGFNRVEKIIVLRKNAALALTKKISVLISKIEALAKKFKLESADFNGEIKNATDKNNEAVKTFESIADRSDAKKLFQEGVSLIKQAQQHLRTARQFLKNSIQKRK